MSLLCQQISFCVLNRFAADLSRYIHRRPHASLSFTSTHHFRRTLNSTNHLARLTHPSLRQVSSIETGMVAFVWGARRCRWYSRRRILVFMVKRGWIRNWVHYRGISMQAYPGPQVPRCNPRPPVRHVRRPPPQSQCSACPFRRPRWYPKTGRAINGLGHAMDEPGHESDSDLMRESLLHSLWIDWWFTRLPAAGYSLFDNGDIELLGWSRKSHYAHVGEDCFLIPMITIISNTNQLTGKTLQLAEY